MDATVYGNVVDIQLQSMSYLTVTIIHRCLNMHRHNNHAANFRYNIFSSLLMIDCLGID